jgi:hypothetical protein
MRLFIKIMEYKVGLLRDTVSLNSPFRKIRGTGK